MTHDGIHRAIDPRKHPSEAAGGAVRVSHAGTHLCIVGLGHEADRRVSRRSAQAGDLDLVKPQCLEPDDQAGNVVDVGRARGNAGVHAQLGRPSARLDENTERFLHLVEQAGQTAQSVVLRANPVDRHGHHYPSEGREAGQLVCQARQSLGVGPVGRDAERANAGSVISREDLAEILAQQGLPASQGNVARSPRPRSDAADSGKIQFVLAPHCPALGRIETVATVRVAAVRHEVDQISRHLGPTQTAKVAQEHGPFGGAAAHGMRGSVAQSKQPADHDRRAGRDMEEEHGRQDGYSVASLCFAPERPRGPQARRRAGDADRQQQRKHPACGRKQDAQDEHATRQPLPGAAHHRIEDAILAQQRNVVARARHQLAQVVRESRLMVLDPQLAREPEFVPLRSQATTEFRVLERDSGVFAEAAVTQENLAADHADRSAERARRRTIEPPRTHDAFAHVQVAGETPAARVRVTVATRNGSEVRMLAEETHTAAEERRIAKARIRIQEEQKLAARGARSGIARGGRTPWLRVAETNHALVPVQHGLQRIARAIIDDDHLVFADGPGLLRGDRVQQRPDDMGAVAHRNDYGKLHAIDVCMNGRGAGQSATVFYSPRRRIPDGSCMRPPVSGLWQSEMLDALHGAHSTGAK